MPYSARFSRFFFVNEIFALRMILRNGLVNWPPRPNNFSWTIDVTRPGSLNSSHYAARKRDQNIWLLNISWYFVQFSCKSHQNESEGFVEILSTLSFFPENYTFSNYKNCIYLTTNLADWKQFCIWWLTSPYKKIFFLAFCKSWVGHCWKAK